MRPIPFDKLLVHEDADVLVIDKPAGLLTSTVPRERRLTLWAMVREHLAQTDRRARPGLIHRLDRDASGLLVFSKNDAAYRSLKRQFKDHSVTRIYSAVVWGVPNPTRGTIRSKLVELADGRVRTTRRPDAGIIAVTEYQLVASTNDRSLLSVKLQTGRKHQIRAHLSERGHPIVNDPLYGEHPVRGRMMLAAVELAFRHPRSNERVTFRLDPLII
jgi:23S rRNA pseudouridine1911/1915/1917 synthase